MRMKIMISFDHQISILLYIKNISSQRDVIIQTISFFALYINKITDCPYPQHLMSLPTYSTHDT